jgi:hypothetical protein
MLAGTITPIIFIGILGAAIKSPTPHEVPIALESRSPILLRIAEKVETSEPGAFLVEKYPSAAAAATALRNQHVYGALVLEPAPTLLVTEATGLPASSVIGQEFGAAAAKTPLAVRDIAPFPMRDEDGLSAFLLIFGLTIASELFSVMLYLRARTIGRYRHVGLAALFSVFAGIAGALTVDLLLGVLPGHFLTESAIGALLTFSIVMVIRAVICIIGPAGIPLAIIWFVPVSIAASGGLLQYLFLPAFYRVISQAIPAGASLTIVMRLNYFGGREIVDPTLTLAVWAAAGTACALVASVFRDRYSAETAL